MDEEIIRHDARRVHSSGEHSKVITVAPDWLENQSITNGFEVIEVRRKCMIILPPEYGDTDSIKVAEEKLKELENELEVKRQMKSKVRESIKR